MTKANLPEQLERGKPPIVNRDRDRAKFALKAVRKGHSTTMAAQAAGVSRRTLYDWRYKAEEIRRLQEEAPEELPLTPYDSDYLWFLREWEKAELKRKEELLKRIEDAGEDKWQANAWLLERLHPEEFSLRRTVEVADRRREKDVWTVRIGDNIAALGQNGNVEDADYEIIEG